MRASPLGFVRTDVYGRRPWDAGIRSRKCEQRPQATPKGDSARLSHCRNWKSPPATFAPFLRRSHWTSLWAAKVASSNFLRCKY